MKYITLITASTGIALALMTALPALADDNVTASGDATVTTGSAKSESHAGIRIGLPHFKLMGSTTPRGDEMKGPGNHATSTENRIEKGQQRGDNMIDQRIKSLQNLLDRISKMKLLPANDLASIQASITAEVQTLTDLKAKIGSDTQAATVKADDSSITKANRVYLLVMPKAHIAATADRIKAVATQMQSLAAKLSARITTAQTAGVNVSVAVTALADYNAKVADAKVQADAAVAETVNLQPDNGDKTIQASNTAVLKDAQAKLKTAEAGLKTARADVKTIVGVIKEKGADSTATTTP